MKRFGLVGYPLGHSYSKKFFEKKFKELELDGYIYQLFEIEDLKEFSAIWTNHLDLIGVNVTIPHKENIIRFLDVQDASVHKVGAANVIKKLGNQLKGYNTDYYAFKRSLEKWLDNSFEGKALVLGSGGASKAVKASLKDLKIDFDQASRREKVDVFSYEQLRDNPNLITNYKLIINSTPLGTYPNVKTLPDLPYQLIDESYWLYDLVYNPDITAFMQKGIDVGAKVKNGLEMLIGQAEESWRIWKK